MAFFGGRPHARAEHVLVQRHPHWKMMIAPALWMIGSTAIAGALIGLIEVGAPAGIRGGAIALVAALWAVLVAVRFFRPYVSWWRTVLIITDQRIAVREGLFARRGFDIPLQRVAGVRFRCTFSDRLAKTGTLIVSPVGEPPFEFAHVPGIRDTHAVLYAQVFGTGPAPKSRRFFGLLKAK
ncbi:PH domain-containing protein [Hoyosella sp. YIM 151337]|uniref:PH domain-containing protein n=1 Tax=Hoyosella sp. YIM 151337 TaxID=2992742 RepID=UPI0022368E0F|nr:PH domain-containing protein [Hoyosella sp. YIM 151337]MCW4352336.1 PH domain-containing protein [Hoyosella sp. YIM 151337]